MSDFRDFLADPKKLATGLKSIQMTEKQRDDMTLLYNAKRGIPVERDKGNRVRGPSVFSCSKIGADLTRHFSCEGPGDKMIWIGLIKLDSDGNELWVMRNEVRVAMIAAGVVEAA